jgi:hypothetical protein
LYWVYKNHMTRSSVKLNTLIIKTTMKNKLLSLAFAGSIALLSACGGYHSDKTNRDSVGNRYGTDTAKTAKTNQDTSKVTTTTGDASSLDNSASGGTKTIKDSSKQSAHSKK